MHDFYCLQAGWLLFLSLGAVHKMCWLLVQNIMAKTLKQWR
jgi:hypothetical protein